MGEHTCGDDEDDHEEDDHEDDILWRKLPSHCVIVMKVIQCWKLSCDVSYLAIKIICESSLVIKVILWWKLGGDEIYPVIKV